MSGFSRLPRPTSSGLHATGFFRATEKLCVSFPLLHQEQGKGFLHLRTGKFMSQNCFFFMDHVMPSLAHSHKSEEMIWVRKTKFYSSINSLARVSLNDESES